MKRFIILPFLLSCALAQSTDKVDQAPEINAAELYQTYCANCHGVNMEGAQHAPLRKTNWLYGRDRIRIYRSIMNGIPNSDMIPCSELKTWDQGIMSELGMPFMMDR